MLNVPINQVLRQREEWCNHIYLLILEITQLLAVCLRQTESKQTNADSLDSKLFRKYHKYAHLENITSKNLSNSLSCLNREIFSMVLNKSTGLLFHRYTCVLVGAIFSVNIKRNNFIVFIKYCGCEATVKYF